MAYTFTYPDGSPGKIDDMSLSKEQALAEASRMVAQWKQGQGSTAGDALGPALEGLTGGFLDEASGALGVLIGAIAGDNNTVAERYRQGYEGSKARRERFAAANPKTSTALELGGSVASFGLLPEIKAAQALGVGGRLAGRAVNAAATGAGYGALAGAGYAESPGGLDSSPTEIAGSTLAGAAGGATVGGLAGAVAEPLIAGGSQLIRGGAGALRRAAVGDTTRADVEATIGRNIRRESGMTPDELVARMQELQGEGYPAVVGDMGGVRTRRMARAAADVSPEAQATLEGVTLPRYEAQGARTEAAIERASGGVGEETRFGLQDRIAAAERERGGRYHEAYQHGDEGISWTPQLDDLARNEPDFQNAMLEARDRLRANNAAARTAGQRQWDIEGRAPGPASGLPGGGSGPRLTLAYWDQVKRALDRRINIAGTNEAGRQTEQARALDIMRRHLVQHLDREVPSYRDARGLAHDLFGGRSALQIGEAAFDANMPAVEVRRVLADLTPSEQRLFQMGWISKMQTKVHGIGDTRDIGKLIAQSPQARDQLETVFGRPAAQRLIRHRNIERGLELLHKEVSGNSKTVRYGVGLAGAGLKGAGVGSLLGIGPLVGAVAGMGVDRIATALSGAVNERAARWIAEALSSSDPELLRRVATAARQRPEIRAALSRLGRMVTGATVGATQQ